MSGLRTALEGWGFVTHHRPECKNKPFAGEWQCFLYPPGGGEDDVVSAWGSTQLGALLDAVSAALAQSDGWQPIETAPKGAADLIDLWSNGSRVADCQWASPGGVDPTKDKTWITWLDDGWKDVVREPTHWMPIPPPPVAA